MSPEAFQPFIDALADALAPRVAAKMGETTNNPNQLMTVPQIAKELRLSHAAVRNLINAGTLHRAPDIREMRVKRSEVNAFGTKESK